MSKRVSHRKTTKEDLSLKKWGPISLLVWNSTLRQLVKNSFNWSHQYIALLIKSLNRPSQAFEASRISPPKFWPENTGTENYSAQNFCTIHLIFHLCLEVHMENLLLQGWTYTLVINLLNWLLPTFVTIKFGILKFDHQTKCSCW